MNQHDNSPGDERAPTGSTTPKTPAVDPRRLSEALARLQAQCQLTDRQLTALPTLAEVTLIPQHDSHLIVSAAGVRPAHPFKLFVGQMEWKMEGKVSHDNAYVYLFKGRGKQMRMEICSPDADGRWAPFEATYFGSLKHLAYPFNEWISAPRFIAAVKFYFMLAWESALFTENPGFEVTNSWANDLHGACDDLIEAKRRERVSRQFTHRGIATTSKGAVSSNTGAIEKSAKAHPRNDQRQTRRRASSIRRVKQVAGEMVSDADDSGNEPRRGQVPHSHRNYPPYAEYPLIAPSDYDPPRDRYYPSPHHIPGPRAMYGTPPPRLAAALLPPPGYYGPPGYYPPYSDREDRVFPPPDNVGDLAHNSRAFPTQGKMNLTYGSYAEPDRASSCDQVNISTKSPTHQHATTPLSRKTSATALQAAPKSVSMKGRDHTG